MTYIVICNGPNVIPEIGKIVEKRHEMILAHEKFGVKMKNITGESVSPKAHIYPMPGCCTL